MAALRRALPAGGPVEGDYRFITEDGPSDFAGLFGDKDTLIIYSMMFGPERERPCPMCTNQMGPWDANAADIARKASLVVVCRSPVERLTAWKRERGWQNLRLVSDASRTQPRLRGILPDGSEIPALHNFTRRDGTIRHFWASEMSDVTADPGQDHAATPQRSGSCSTSRPTAATPTGTPRWITRKPGASRVAARPHDQINVRFQTDNVR